MSKIYDGIMGLVVGDALGVPVEFANCSKCEITDMIGYGVYNQPLGTWSDDSSMTLATLESIGRLGKIDYVDIMNNFVKWFLHGDFTPHGEVFDVGRTTSIAIGRYINGISIDHCGCRNVIDNGNGSLMRILPLVFVPHTERDISKVSGLTHAHQVSKTACSIYIYLAEKLISGMPIKEAICSLAYLEPVKETYEFKRLSYIGELSRDEVDTSAYVVGTLEAALWCLWRTNNYRDCVLTTVNLGGDTDTIAAVAGGLAGIAYGCGGENGVPQKWIDKIARTDFIKTLCERVEFHTMTM